MKRTKNTLNEESSRKERRRHKGWNGSWGERAVSQSKMRDLFCDYPVATFDRLASIPKANKTPVFVHKTKYNFQKAWCMPAASENQHNTCCVTSKCVRDKVCVWGVCYASLSRIYQEQIRSASFPLVARVLLDVVCTACLTLQPAIVTRGSGCRVPQERLLKKSMQSQHQ